MPAVEDCPTLGGVEPSQEVAEEVRRWRQRLRALLTERDRSMRSVEQQLGWANGYLGQVLRGSPELRVRHVLELLDALEIPWRRFFAELYGERPRLRADAPASDIPMSFDELWDLVTRLVEAGQEPDSEPGESPGSRKPSSKPRKLGG